MTSARDTDGAAELATSPPPAHDARDLTGGGDRARIVLEREVHTLRITRAGKLILTK